MSAPRFFADTAYYIALLTVRDALHDAALTIGRSFGSAEIVTTDAVLVEVFAFVSGRGRHHRLEAVKLVDMLGADPDVTIVHQTAELFFLGRGSVPTASRQGV